MWGARTRRCSGALLQLSFAVALCVCRAASAAESPPIPEECGSLAEFQRELQNRLGRETDLTSTRVSLTPEVSGYRLVVEVGSERRELHDANCRELLRAAVVIALAILEPAKQPASEAPRPEPARTQPAPQGRPSERSAPHFPPSLALGAGGGVHLGTLPHATLLLDLDAQLRWSHFGAALGLRYLLPASVQDARNRGARVGGLGVYAAGIFEPWPRVQARLGFVAYRLSGTGLGSLERSEDVAWEAGPILGASFIPFQRPPFWTSVGGEGQLNLLRSRFRILDYGSVFRVPWLSASAFARAGVVW